MRHYSYLFVPGDRPERFDKAAASGAHAVIFDLEDAVAPAQKDAARTAVNEWLAARAPSDLRIAVRINAADTEWYEQDHSLFKHAALNAVMLPKAQDADVLAALSESLQAHQALLPLVETVLGLDQARYLGAVKKVERLAFGSVDFNADAGIGSDGDALNTARSLLVIASRLAGVGAPIDGVSLALDDADALALDIERARRFGFAAKLCIHPKQLQAVNTGFAPTPAEIDWAHRVDAAVKADGLGAIQVDGKLVDKPVYTIALKILAQAAP